LEKLTVHYDKSLNKSGDYMEELNNGIKTQPTSIAMLFWVIMQ
jgi:hypothetical protein